MNKNECEGKVDNDKISSGSQNILRYSLKVLQIDYTIECVRDVIDLSDAAEAGVGSISPHAINYSTLGSTTPAPGADPALSSTETLLRNIQGLLKVAADNARQQERQINYEKGRSNLNGGFIPRNVFSTDFQNLIFTNFVDNRQKVSTQNFPILFKFLEVIVHDFMPIPTEL